MGFENAPIVEDSKSHSLEIPDKGTLNGLTILDGKTKKEKCHRYSGVRYAKPPTGELRWKRPQPLPKDYDYTGDYTGFGSVCPQPQYAGLEKVQHPAIEYDEDCLFLNIWVPAGTPPPGGWPVMYFIHGGFLQMGNPHQYREVDPQDLLAEGSPVRYIVVSPGYRLNLFGFLSSQELLEEDPMSTNFGFWDQRLGLEWVYNNIEHFGGDKNNIAAGGLSAGSYSAVFQLAYEMYHSDQLQIIKKVHLASNGLAVQPKTVSESQKQFDLLLEAFGIPLNLSSQEKMDKLREIPYQELSGKIMSLKYHTFRAVTDQNHFIPENLLQDIISGKFGQIFNNSGRQIIIGEVINEYSIYRNTNPPETPEAVERELVNYYPQNIVTELLKLYPKIPNDSEKAKELFGSIVGDMQVYSSGRILVESLIRGGVPLDRIHRYRVAYRAKFVDNHIPPEEKVPHGGDMVVWFYTVVNGILEQEKPEHEEWLQPVHDFMYNKPNVSWGTSNKAQYRIFEPDGKIQVRDDEMWDWAMKVRQAISSAIETQA